MELNKIQEQIVKTDRSKVLVDSAAASGKTALIVERIRYLLNSGVEPSKIVAITFTNNAANEMLERLGRPNGLFIGTVHSYCNYLLRSNSIDTSSYIEKEDFDELFHLVRENPSCIKPIDHLIVDEAQDSTDPQFDFFELLKPKNFMYCYDPRQSIYGFADANPERILQMEHQPDVTVYEMNQNYRNGYNILNFAKNLLYNLGSDFEDRSIAVRAEDGYVYHTHWSYSDVVDFFAGLSNKEYDKWFLLCRTNQEISILADMFDKAGIPYTTFKQAQLTTKEIEEELESNKVKILTIHSAKGLESDNVLVLNSQLYNNEERRLYYVAATRARNTLVWNKLQKKKKPKIRTMNWE